jgi:hypothetical protein
LLCGYKRYGVIHILLAIAMVVSTVPSHSEMKNTVVIWTIAGEDEIFGKDGQQVRKDFAKASDTFSRKGLAINHMNTNLQRKITAMKKRNIVIHFLVLLMLIATFAACAATRTQESVGEYVDDSVITNKVKSLLAEDDFLKSFEISVESFKGTVQLSGFVNSQQAVYKADEIVRSIQWVKSVKNNLIVK